jgi:hypothetical protein
LKGDDTLAKMMRCYFHVINGSARIMDDVGIDVSDLDQARSEAIEAVREMRAQDPQLAKESACWALTTTDESGVVLFKIPLILGQPDSS